LPCIRAAGSSSGPCAWLTAHRRLARDYERHPEVSKAIIRWAAINGMIRRITDHPRPARPAPTPPHLQLDLINISNTH